MQRFTHFIRCGFVLLAAVLLAGCEPDEQGPHGFDDNDNFSVKLSAEKAIGRGQYRQRVESGDETAIQVQVKSATALKEMRITKTVNLAKDESFGSNGVLVVGASGTSVDYEFTYTPTTGDVDQLVGFTFEAENTAGQKQVSDLTLVVTLSPRDNLPRRRWALTSVYHVNEEEETIKECEKDNTMLLNADSTVVIEYGADTGAGDCLFDGFNVYTEWTLSEDEQTFTRKYYGIFSPNTIVTEEFDVVTLTVDKLVLKQTMDLSAFGLSTEETFLFTYVATPR